jgi:hypothetical protein
MVAGQKRRPPDDFFPTERAATVALLRQFGPLLRPGAVWEPACGAGHIAKVLVEHGLSVVASDLNDRGYGTPARDYLTAAPPPLLRAIVTNPPFKFAEQFIRKAVGEAEVVAMLLKSDYWHTKGRMKLFEELKPRWEAKLTWRIDFTGQGRPIMNCSWNIWTRGWSGDCSVVLLLKPDEGVFA